MRACGGRGGSVRVSVVVEVCVPIPRSATLFSNFFIAFFILYCSLHLSLLSSSFIAFFILNKSRTLSRHQHAMLNPMNVRLQGRSTPSTVWDGRDDTHVYIYAHTHTRARKAHARTHTRARARARVLKKTHTHTHTRAQRRSNKSSTRKKVPLAIKHGRKVSNMCAPTSSNEVVPIYSKYYYHHGCPSTDVTLSRLTNSTRN